MRLTDSVTVAFAAVAPPPARCARQHRRLRCGRHDSSRHPSPAVATRRRRLHRRCGACCWHAHQGLV